TGLDVANASLYEGGSAVAEAVIMALSITGRTGKVVIAESVHPEYRRTLATYLTNLEPHIETLPTPDGFLDPSALKRVLDEPTAGRTSGCWPAAATRSSCARCRDDWSARRPIAMASAAGC